MRRVLALLAAGLLAAGCAEAPRVVVEAPQPPRPEAKPVPGDETPKFKESTLKLLAARGMQPQPNRPINVASECAHKDAIGTRTKLSLQVDEALVKAFDAEVAIKGRGICRFGLAEFEQVQKMPQVLLKHKQQRNCLVRMWEEGAKVTVAFNSCAQSCEGKAFDYLWPIVVETKNGRCY